MMVCGGADEKEISRAVDLYDFSTRKWSIGPNLVTARKHPASCSFEGCVYVSCGTGYGFSNLLSIERLDLGAQKWR